jgi:FKBP-type peptidyl-prolyl cis-trans isomerase FklB
MHYHVELLNGTVIHSSYQRGEPLKLAPMQSPDRWSQEAMEMMNPGSKWEVYIPPKVIGEEALAKLGVDEGSVLIYTLEMLDFPGMDDVVSRNKTESNSTGEEDVKDEL